MTRRLTASYWKFALLLPSACSNSEDHPPFCYESRCTPTVAARANGASDAGSADGSVGGSSFEQTVSVKGQIVEALEYSRWIEADGTFTLSAPTINGGLVQQSVTSSFSLSGVLASQLAWMCAKPPSQSDLMPGLVMFDASTEPSSTIQIALVRRSELQLVGNLLTSMLTLDDTKAQLVVRFVNSKQEPISGISAQMPGSVAAARAYDLGAGYTDTATSTGNRGLVFFLNVDASASPSVRSLTLSGARSAELLVPVMAGATTMLGFVM